MRTTAITVAFGVDVTRARYAIHSITQTFPALPSRRKYPWTRTIIASQRRRRA